MGVIKKTFKIEGMDCPSCAIMLDDVLEEMPGVLKSSTSYTKGQVEVEFEDSKVVSEDMVSSIENGGYTVMG